MEEETFDKGVFTEGLHTPKEEETFNREAFTVELHRSVEEGAYDRGVTAGELGRSGEYNEEFEWRKEGILIGVIETEQVIFG